MFSKPETARPTDFVRPVTLCKIYDAGPKSSLGSGRLFSTCEMRVYFIPLKLFDGIKVLLRVSCDLEVLGKAYQ